MKNEPLVVVYDKMTSSKVRIMRVFETQGINVQDAKNEMELINILSSNDKSRNILILSADDELAYDVFDLIRKVKTMYSDVYIVVLTANTKREFFAKCMTENVDDYILKPFEDYMLKERVDRLINQEEEVIESILKFNFQRYLRSEIVKAKKGNYQFALLKSTIMELGDNGYNRVGKEFARYAGNVYEQLSELFWETDIFMQSGIDNYYGFFPFCGEENSVLIEKKLNRKYASLKEENGSLKKYDIINSYVFFPDDGDDVEYLLKKLSDRIDSQINTDVEELA